MVGQVHNGSTQRTCCRCFLPAPWETWTPSNLQISCTNTRHKDLSCCSAGRKFLILVLTQSWLGCRFAASIECEVEGLVISGGSYQSALGIFKCLDREGVVHCSVHHCSIPSPVAVLPSRLSGHSLRVACSSWAFCVLCGSSAVLDGACLGLCFVVRRFCCF